MNNKKDLENEVEDLPKPEKIYAVRFDDEECDKGTYVLYTRTEGVALPHNVFLVRREALALLDKAGIDYKLYVSETGDLREVYNHFNMDADEAFKMSPEPSWLELITQYIKLKIRNRNLD